MDEMSGLTTSPCHFSFGVEVVPLVRGHLAAALDDALTSLSVAAGGA